MTRPAVTLHLGDCLDVLRQMPEASVDAVVTDPPYGLSFMGKRWDYDVPAVEVWAGCLRVLKPGGHLLAFAGARTRSSSSSRRLGRRTSHSERLSDSHGGLSRRPPHV